jgi:hypothetical protein
MDCELAVRQIYFNEYGNYSPLRQTRFFSIREYCGREFIRATRLKSRPHYKVVALLTR